jgi:hypothetical protein
MLPPASQAKAKHKLTFTKCPNSIIGVDAEDKFVASGVRPLVSGVPTLKLAKIDDVGEAGCFALK